MTRSHNGTFIVLEGLDGSGQSTQTNLLKQYLERQGKNILVTKEPTQDTDAGRKAREALRKKIEIDPKELQRLFTEDRKAHVEKVIFPTLEKGITVISDRYYFSTFAFGSIDCDLEWLIEINKDFPHPDITFVLDVSAQTAVDRIQKRGKAVELFEVKDKLKKVMETYWELSQRFENTHIINGERSIEEVHQEIIKTLTNHL